jgi:8-oxo-dGTP diphosphatase
MNTERQISAGGVIFRPSGGRIEVALISVKGGKVWALPKGLNEKGENLARTAHREVKEETGLDGKILTKIGYIDYFFMLRDEGQMRRIFKIVYFFLMEYAGGSVEDHDEEVVECRWFDINEAIKLMKYEDEKEILKKARKLIKELKGKAA